MDPKYEFDAPQFVDFNVFENTAEADALFDMTTVGDPKLQALARKGLRDVSNTPECPVISRPPKHPDGSPVAAPSPRAPVTRAVAMAAACSSPLLTPEKHRRPKSPRVASGTQAAAATRSGGTPAAEAAADTSRNVSPAVSELLCKEASSELQRSFARGISNQSTACKKSKEGLQPCGTVSSPSARTLRPRALLLLQQQPSTLGFADRPSGRDDSTICASQCTDVSSSNLSVDDASASTNSERRGGKRSASSSHSSLPRGSATAGGQPQAKMPKLTIPVTPPFAKQRPRRQAAADVKTTEQLELEEIANMRKKLQQQRKRNAQATVVIGDGSKSTAGSSAVKSAGDGGGGRQSSVKVTVPQPFHFHASHRQAAVVPAAVPFRSTAELLEQFSRKTPQRFHAKPSTPGEAPETHSPDRPGSQCGKRPTVPKTPNLLTMKRQRRPAYHIPSAEEREQQELEDMKAHQFKAHPVDHRIFEKVIGVKTADQKELTEVVAPHFATEDRLKKRAAAAALAVPASVDDEKEPATTSAVSTECASANSAPSATAVVPPSRHHTGLPFHPKLKHKHTVVQAFSFEHKDKEIEQRRQQLLQQAIEEEKKAREFHAQPLPATPKPLPPRKVVSPTHVEEFNLAIDIRGAAYQAKLKHQLEEEERQREEQIHSLMRTKTPDVLYKEPFRPHKSQKPLTEPQEIRSELDKRVPAWEQHDAEMKQREADIEAAKRIKQQQEEAAERAEIARLRAQAVVRQNPIKHFKPLQILPSDKPVTEPCSPRFSERLNRKRPASTDSDARTAKTAKNFP